MSASSALAPTWPGARSRADSSWPRAVCDVAAREQHARVRHQIVRAQGGLRLDRGRPPVGLLRALEIAARLGGLAGGGVRRRLLGRSPGGPRCGRLAGGLPAGAGGRRSRRRRVIAPGSSPASAAATTLSLSIVGVGARLGDRAARRRASRAAGSGPSAWSRGRSSPAARAAGARGRDGAPGRCRSAPAATRISCCSTGPRAATCSLRSRTSASRSKSPVSVVSASSASSASIDVGSSAIARSSSMPASPGSASRLRRISAAATRAAARSGLRGAGARVVRRRDQRPRRGVRIAAPRVELDEPPPRRPDQRPGPRVLDADLQRGDRAFLVAGAFAGGGQLVRDDARARGPRGASSTERRSAATGGS